MTVGLIGGGAEGKEEVVETDEEPAMGSEAECEVFTTLEDGAGKCLLPYGDIGGSGVQTLCVGDEMWLLDTETGSHFTHDSTKLVV